MLSWFGEFFTLALMAFALGMDAFSVGLGLGMLHIRLRQIFKIGITVGLFHVFMPLTGMIGGRVLSEKFGIYAVYLGGGLLILLGMQMIYSSLKKEDTPLITPVGIGLFLFAFSVSIDSFSVGLTLGIYGAKTVLALICFGAGACILSWLGLLIGRNFHSWLGSYSEALGGSILFAFGLKLLFHI